MLLSLVLAGLVLVAAPFVYISQAGGLSGLVSNELSSRLGGVPVAVADVGIEVRLPSFGVTLEATGVEIDLDEHRLETAAGECRLFTGTLLKGMPSEIVLSGLDFDLSLDSEKWRSSPLGDGVGASPRGPGRACRGRRHRIHLLAGKVSSAEDAADCGRGRAKAAADTAPFHHPSDDAEPVLLENIEFEFAAAPDGTFVGLVEAERVIDGNSAGTLAVSAIGDLLDRISGSTSPPMMFWPPICRPSRR